MLRAASVVIVLAVLLGPTILAAQPDTLGGAIVKFCKDNLGKQVGAGECSHLAEEALKAAGAKPSFAFKPSPAKDDYVWGDFVYSLEVTGDKREEKKTPRTDIMPGDIIQFRNARFQGKTYFTFAPHHTAIVVQVKDRAWVVLEQNSDGKKFVTEKTYKIDDLKAGWVRVYHPLPK